MKPIVTASQLLFLLFIVVSSAFGAGSVPCPNLFFDAQTAVGIFSVTASQQLNKFESLIKSDPKLKPGSSHTWENVSNGIERKYTLSLDTDGSYSYEFDVAPVATGVFVKVSSGTLSTVAHTSTTETLGNVSYDYTAYSSVIPTAQPRGQISDNFDQLSDPSKPAPGQRDTDNIVLTNFLPVAGDPHGPQNGTYVGLHEPGVGGYFSLQDSLILPCLSTSLVASETVVSRWYVPSTVPNVLRFTRDDGMAIGGPIATGDQWIALQCMSKPPSSLYAYFLLKLEDASGNTLTGSVKGTGACDSAFGPVPQLDNNSTDYNFSQTPTFPNEW